MKKLLTVCLAVILDLTVGDPPNQYHPVAWMGNLIAWLKKFAPQEDAQKQMAYGLLTVSLGGALANLFGQFVEALVEYLPQPLDSLIEAAALKMTFSLGGLSKAAEEIDRAFSQNDLPAARRLLSWHLVSRDTSQLDESQVAAAAIESVAENASDGVIAPMFYYTLGGLPLALTYRFINTVDSMWGYRSQTYEYLGKVPARLDDLVNFIPARLSAFSLVLAAEALYRRGRAAFSVLRRDAAKTESPNAGYPMSAMAGALGVELEKVDLYQLGEGLPQPRSGDIVRARRLLFAGTGVALALLALLLGRSRRR